MGNACGRRPAATSVPEIVAEVGDHEPTFHEEDAAVFIQQRDSGWCGAMFLCDGGAAVAKFGYRGFCGNEPIHDWGFFMTGRWRKHGLEWSEHTQHAQPRQFRALTVACLLCVQQETLDKHITNLLLRELNVQYLASSTPLWVSKWADSQVHVGGVRIVEDVRVCRTFHDAQPQEDSSSDFLIACNDRTDIVTLLECGTYFGKAEARGESPWYHMFGNLKCMKVPSRPATWSEAHEHETIQALSQVLSHPIRVGPLGTVARRIMFGN